MFEACDPYETDDGHWRCATCGDTWDEEAGEACPCGACPRGWRGWLPSLVFALMPTSLLGLVVWTIAGAGLAVLAFAGLMAAADRGLRLLLSLAAG